MVAVAGELATHYGLTGWPQGEAISAAEKCFASWVEGFGTTCNREEREVLSQIRAFFEAHGSSRFEDLSAAQDQRIPNRVGFTRNLGAGDREYAVLPEAFKRELCAGFDHKTAAVLLLEKGWIVPAGDGRATQKRHKIGRVYIFSPKVWEGEE